MQEKDIALENKVNPRLDLSKSEDVKLDLEVSYKLNILPTFFKETFWNYRKKLIIK